ncbi:MAG TPA: acetyl-CoA carboxylase biotin carboxyl carrier protein subunit [Fibrobacteria bacterium]|nr:acetyl-CoA carboxylase biotin carboxyl carrier protein subunit [Fibrobacteria bacterium]HOX50990.1 acetyl-CoA carboxylase biotin carboxyl carrier protein subunit [Fibrobacteria bacterium]
MKMKLSVDGRVFEVQVGDLVANPVVVMVEGERIEVWPEEETPAVASTAAPAIQPRASHVPVPVWKPRKTDVLPGTENAVIAPIPGVIVQVDVKVGDRVAYGQVVCLLEAMKMRNPIRVARAGVVTEIKIKPGQHVHYHEQLIVVTPES